MTTPNETALCVCGHEHPVLENSNNKYSKGKYRQRCGTTGCGCYHFNPVNEPMKTKNETALKATREVFDLIWQWQNKHTATVSANDVHTIISRHLSARDEKARTVLEKVIADIDKLQPEKDCPFCDTEPCHHCLEMARVQGRLLQSTTAITELMKEMEK